MSVLPQEGTHPILYGSIGVPVGSGFQQGYLARPDLAGAFPVVLVLHDIYGLTSHEKDLCRRLARHGLVALAVDMYRGSAPRRNATLDEAVTAYQMLPDDRALRDVDEAYEFLMSRDVPWAVKGPVGLLGVDVGGRLALLYAATHSHVAAVAAVCAPLAGDEERAHQVAAALREVAVPVLGLYGGDDELIPPQSVDVARQIAAGGMWLLYEGVGHDFVNEASAGYDGDAASDALARLTEFFTVRLAQAQPSPTA